MQPLGLRARLVAAFVGIAALTTLVAAVLTSGGPAPPLRRLRRRSHTGRDSKLARPDPGRRTQSRAGGLIRPRPSGPRARPHRVRLPPGGGWPNPAAAPRSRDAQRRGSSAVALARSCRRGVRTWAASELFALGPGRQHAADTGLPGGARPCPPARRGDRGDRGDHRGTRSGGTALASAGSCPWRRGDSPAEAGLPSCPPGHARRPRLGESPSGLAPATWPGRQKARRQLASRTSPTTPYAAYADPEPDRGDAGRGPAVRRRRAGDPAHRDARLSRLIGQIERLAEAEAHPSPLRAEPIALDELAREAHGASTAAFEIRGLRSRSTHPPTPGCRRPRRRAQIITNLLSNALKYAPEGSRVQLLTMQDGGDVPAERARRGGRPAGRGHRSGLRAVLTAAVTPPRRAGGRSSATIARNLAEAQKGTLAMAAEEKDTCFILSLPAATPPSPPVDRRDAKAALRHLRVMDR